MHFTTTVTAAMGLVSLASAHIKMTSPTPFDAGSLDNAPLFADGSNFPCKLPNYSAAQVNSMEAGKPQTLALVGSAVHGGGSCQISITYDNPPKAESEWKVIHSIEGGCPMAGVSGNNGDNAASPVPDTFQYTIPTNLQTGPAVLAWTWFNKIGNREMYMNCAPIDIKPAGGASKRSPQEELESRIASKIASSQQSGFKSLPDMFLANIGKGCSTLEGTDVEFPNPGQSLDFRQKDSMKALGKPVGSCGPAGVAPSPVEVPGVAPDTTSAPLVSNEPLPGGVFNTIGESVIAPVPTRVNENKPAEPEYSAPAETAPSPTSTPAAPTEEPSAPEPEPEAPIVPSAPETPAGNDSAPAVPLPVVGGNPITPGSPCPGDEGQWNCIGGSSFQRCASGMWSVIQSVAAGTECEPGVSAVMKIVANAPRKRFSNPHIRRHLMGKSF